MPRFFVPSDEIDCAADGRSGTIAIRGDDAVHITKVLRMRAGETVTVCDMAGRDFETVLVSAGNPVVLQIRDVKPSESEPPYRATVYQALVRGDRFDTVLQKATELGACAVVPVLTARCTVKLDPGSADSRKKLERWQRIVYEAAKQCGRGRIPVVREPMKFRDALEEAAHADLPLFCYEGKGTEPLPEWLKTCGAPETVSILIGPEGGYSAEEAEMAAQSGMRMTGLGRRILRTETAPVFVLSCVSCNYELST
ncbi:MAG: 16S rRNA (uracil(1498)-N(3))-methyltransferase [Eubacteriales bacterium]